MSTSSLSSLERLIAEAIVLAGGEHQSRPVARVRRTMVSLEDLR